QPESFAGAIVLSPGTRGPSQLDKAFHSPLLRKRGFVLVCGAQEHPGNVQRTAQDAEWLRAVNARVLHKPYEGMSEHTFPADFAERLPEWIRFIESAVDS